MRTILFFLLFVAFCNASYSQYYLRGELKDEQGNGLQGARIALFSKGNYPFYTGTDGVFGLPSSLKTDTITFMMEGYDTMRLPVATSQYGKFIMKFARKKSSNTLHLSSYTTRFPYPVNEALEDDNILKRTAYLENPVVNPQNYPETVLGLHVDKSSYSNIRRMLNNNELPIPDEVKIEEMLNYFNLKTIEADPQKTFTFNSQITSCPWNANNRLLLINLRATKINLDTTPAANLVFLIDASGSMDVVNRLPLIKSAFKLLTENLRPTDKVTIVTYGDVVTELLAATPGSEKQKIIESIEGLRPNGNTPGASAINMAYQKARGNFITNGNNRIILATDGDFNVGSTNFKGLEEMAARESKAGIYLSCLGVGIDKDENLEALAKAGQGNFAYLDNESDAEKILINEFAKNLFAVAENVFLNVQFNASAVSAYRLIGFDNKKSALNAKITDLSGGEAGGGQSFMAAFEITPAGNGSAQVANLSLSYNLPNNTKNFKEDFSIVQNFDPLEKLPNTYRFASAVLAFGEMMKQSEYYKDFTWSDLEHLTASALTPGDLLQKELTEMIVKARKIYPSRRKMKLVKTD